MQILQLFSEKKTSLLSGRLEIEGVLMSIGGIFASKMLGWPIFGSLCSKCRR